MYMHIMTTIDQFGRIVIPKNIREHQGLHPGTVLEIQEKGETIILKLMEEKPVLQNEGGALVYSGKILGDITKIIENVREDRLKDLGE